jgi:8-oxo-dGTP pyrophosphatase MutT (NUDIX family)
MERVALDVGSDFFVEMLTRAARSPGEVVIVVSRPAGKIILSTKSFYPKGVYRLPTGKMKKPESPDEAALRETYEETGHEIQSAGFLGTILCYFTSQGETVTFPSHVLVTEEIEGSIAPIDEHEGIIASLDTPPCCLRTVATQLRDLPAPWADWGKWRAVAHDFVYEALCKQEL